MASKSLTFDIFGRDRTASKALKGVSGSVGGLNKKFNLLAGGIAAAFSVRAVVDFGKAAVTAFLEAEKAQFAMQDAFDRFPQIADTNMKELQDLAKATMLKTGYDDDAITTGIAQLAQYKLTGAQLKQLTPLMVDFARKTGKDLPTAAEDLGKALLGQGRSLKEVGIDFKDAGSVAANFDQIIAGLGAQVGGVAEKFGTTDAGKIEILKARFGEIQESIGAALLPVLEQLAPVIEDKIIPALEGLAPTMGPVFAEFGNGVSNWITGFGLIQKAAFKFGEDLHFVFNNIPALGLIAFNALQNFAYTGINNVISALLSIINPINEVLAAIGRITGATLKINVPKIAILPKNDTWKKPVGASGSGGAIRTWASGGILPATPGGINASMGRAAGKFAEAGADELVLPLTESNLAKVGAGIGGGGGAVINIHLTGTYAGSKAELAKTVAGALRDAVKSGQIPAGYALA